MGSANKPNIIFLVWDACRLDYVKQYAPNLNELGDEGVWFENAIAPATWSLPSHASMFTGKYPHEHGMTQPSQSKMPANLVKKLKGEGYSCYGVSGNGFTSRRWGFDEQFDHLRFTQGPEPYGDGKEMYGYLRGKLEHENESMTSTLADAFSESVSHRNTLKSLANLTSVAINHASREVVTGLQKVPHSVFRDGPRYAYSGKKNTTSIKQILRQEAETEEPFFVFSNYMETHRPYIPDEDLQQKHLDRTLDRSELVRLNEEIAESWNFVELVKNGELNEEDVQTLRSLYAGEVETVDRYLGTILDELESQNLLDETLVVVTADHGEMLGEEDSFGRRRMGHQAAMSKHLSKVPLVVSHPQIQHGMIDEHVALKDLFGLFLTSAKEETVSIDPLVTDSGVLCEYPSLGDERMYEEHPDIPGEVIAQRVSQDSVSVHSNGWYIVANSDGDRVAEQNGKRIDVGEGPQDLLDLAESSLEELSQLNKKDVDEETAAHLEDLGYM